MAHVVRVVSDEPIELDISPRAYRGRAFQRDLVILAKLHELACVDGAWKARGTAPWLVANSTGVRFSINNPQVKIYILRFVGDTDEQIETARRALVAELNALWPAEEDAA